MHIQKARTLSSSYDDLHPLWSLSLPSVSDFGRPVFPLVHASFPILLEPLGTCFSKQKQKKQSKKDPRVKHLKIWGMKNIKFRIVVPFSGGVCVCFEEVGGKGGEKLVSNFNCDVSFLQLGVVHWCLLCQGIWDISSFSTRDGCLKG